MYESLKKRMNRGSAAMEFIAILPILLFMIVILIAVIQLSSVQTESERITYNAGRCAVVSASESEARSAINDLLQGVRAGTTPVSFELTADGGWRKGGYATITIRFRTESIGGIFPAEYSKSITMVIENETEVYES